MPSGLLGRLVKAVGLHDEIKDLIQSKIDEKLRGQKILLLKEVRAVVIHSAAFIALDGDGLGLKISAIPGNLLHRAVQSACIEK